MARNEVRVSDSDDEMLAIKALSAALSSLDEQAAKRVLKWADARFGYGVVAAREQEAAAAADVWLEAVTCGMQAVAAAAKEHGVTGRDLMRVLSRAYQDAVDEAKVAEPVGV